MTELHCVNLSLNRQSTHFHPITVDSIKGLSTREAGRGHATPHMPVETAKCWWLLKIEPNAWAGGKGSCAVCVDLQAVGAVEFFGELYSLSKGFGPIFEGVWAACCVSTSATLYMHASLYMPSNCQLHHLLEL